MVTDIAARWPGRDRLARNGWAGSALYSYCYCEEAQELSSSDSPHREKVGGGE